MFLSFYFLVNDTRDDITINVTFIDVFIAVIFTKTWNNIFFARTYVFHPVTSRYFLASHNVKSTLIQRCVRQRQNSQR